MFEWQCILYKFPRFGPTCDVFISYVPLIVTIFVFRICKLCRCWRLFNSVYHTREVKLGRSFQCISLNILLVGKFEMNFVDVVEKYIICLVGINNFLPVEPF